MISNNTAKIQQAFQDFLQRNTPKVKVTTTLTPQVKTLTFSIKGRITSFPASGNQNETQNYGSLY